MMVSGSVNRFFLIPRQTCLERNGWNTSHAAAYEIPSVLLLSSFRAQAL